MSNYALIEIATGSVVNTVVLGEDPNAWSPPEGHIVVQTDVASIGWMYADGVFTPPAITPPANEELASIARQQRDFLLRSVCDPGILMAQRLLRIASTPEQIAYAEDKISELDGYAEALTAIPDQAGFPQTIIWPAAPIK